MLNYWQTAGDAQAQERGMFIVLPLRYDDTAMFRDISIQGEALSFSSNDFIGLMNHKCRSDGDFVRRFKINAKLEPIHMKSDIQITDIQLLRF